MKLKSSSKMLAGRSEFAAFYNGKFFFSSLDWMDVVTLVCVCVWLHVYRDDSISTRVESSAVRNRSTRALLSFVCALIQVHQP